MKKFLSILLVVVMALSMVACGKNDSGKTDAGKTDTGKTDTGKTDTGKTDAGKTDADKGHLNVWLAGNGEIETKEVFEGILDAWVANNAPGYTYELTFVSWTDYFTKLSTALASGAGPDIFMTGYGQLGSILGQDKLVNLTEYIPQDWDGYTDIPENLLSAGMKDGNLYGILEPSTRLYFYRKDIAAQNGVTEEELHIDTPEELKNLVEKMCVYDDKGKLIISGMHIFDMGEESIEQMVHSLALNYDVNYKLWDQDGQASFNTDAGVKAIEWMNSISDQGLNFPYEAGFDQFSNGIAAMSLMSESSYRTYANTFPDQVGILPCTMNTMLIGNFITVNADSKYREKAVDCLMYMFNEESLKGKASLGMFPNRASMWDWYTAEYPEYANVPAYYENSYPFSDTIIPYYNQAIKAFRDASALAQSDGADIKKCLDDGAQEWNDIANGK